MRDNIITERRVLCGPCALARAGLVTYSTVLLFLQTPYKEVDGVSTVYVTYWYYDNIDYDYCVSPGSENPLILHPTKERAIIDYLRCERWCDEGVLIEALHSYLTFFRDDKKLYECADHFGVQREVVDYWIKETLEDVQE